MTKHKIDKIIKLHSFNLKGVRQSQNLNKGGYQKAQMFHNLRIQKIGSSMFNVGKEKNINFIYTKDLGL